MVRKAALVLGALVVVLLVVVSARTVAFSPADIRTVPRNVVSLDSGAAGRLAGALRFATISGEDTTDYAAAFRGLHQHLERAFPRTHSVLEREIVANRSLLFRWAGTDTTMPPILLASHLDVVPVERGTETAWTHPPFAGAIADGFVWGRGAIDNKAGVVGTLEAVETLLREGFRPRRTMYLAFGHDEEVGGSAGAAAIAALLRQQGVRLEMVLDEGGVIGDGLIAGVARPTALIGIAEKGFATVEISASAAGGHSSLPPRSSAIGILSAAVTRLEQNQLGARLEGASHHLFQTVGPHLPMAQRSLFANLWLARPVVLTALERNPTTNAMVRTTTAVTVFQAGTKDNVLPTQARAVINFRILQGDSVAGVLSHVRRVVDDPRVEVRRAGRFHSEPSGVSDPESPAFRSLERSILAVAPDVITAPYLVVVVSDARHYADLSRDVFRFLPLRLASTDLARMHGIDERVAIADYERAVRIYRQVLHDFGGNASSRASAAGPSH